MSTKLKIENVYKTFAPLTFLAAKDL